MCVCYADACCSDLLFVCPGCNDGQASLVCELTLLSLTILPVTGGDGVGFLRKQGYYKLQLYTYYTISHCESFPLILRTLLFSNFS